MIWVDISFQINFNSNILTTLFTKVSEKSTTTITSSLTGNFIPALVQNSASVSSITLLSIDNSNYWYLFNQILIYNEITTLASQSTLTR